LLPNKAGERVKPDRRDAVHLARLARAGERTLVDVPTGDAAAMRDLTRARADALSDDQAATCRRQACVLRHAIRYPGQATWGPAHLRGLSAVGCPTPAPHLVLPE